jgi:hypothetical protein
MLLVKIYLLIFSTTLTETLLILRKTENDVIKMYIGLHIQYAFFLSDFKETLIFSTACRKHSDSKFNKDPSSWSRVVSCRQPDGQTDIWTYGQTDRQT